MLRFKEKFKKATAGQFDYLRLSCVNVCPKAKTAQFCFVAPESEYEKAVMDQAQIKNGVETAFSTALRVEIKIKKSHFDKQFFVLELAVFFDAIASLKGCVSGSNVKILTDDGQIKAVISLKESEYLLFNSRKIKAELDEFIHSNYCEDIITSIVKSDEAEEFIEEDSAGIHYDDPTGRFINVTEVESYIGPRIAVKPRYIVDATSPEAAVVLAGKLVEIKEIERKKKEDGSQPRPFYRLTIEDPTGRMQCVYFPSEKSLPKIKNLCLGTATNSVGAAAAELVVEGELDNNPYSNALNLKIKNISLCSMPVDFKINRRKVSVPKSYKFIFPKPHTELEQASLFVNADMDINEDKACNVSKYLKGKEFVVFDLETTGLNYLSDSIIEIGAVKIRDGVITEIFSSFINPQIPIPERITKITGITDAHLKDALLAGDVLPDFLLFCQNATLVGHNADYFDYPFLSSVSARYDIYFDNKVLDTIVLAKQINLPLRRFTLGDLAAYYNVQNERAHRAVSDAVTTAKVFMAMADKLH